MIRKNENEFKVLSSGIIFLKIALIALLIFTVNKTLHGIDFQKLKDAGTVNSPTKSTEDEVRETNYQTGIQGSQTALNAGNANEALAQANQAIEFAKGNTEKALALFWHGAAYNGLREYTLSQKDLEESIQLDPNHTGAYVSLADDLRMAGDMTGAQENIDKALALNVHFGNAYKEQALIYYDQHNYQAALNSINQALKLDPTDPSFQEVKQLINKALGQ